MIVEENKSLRQFNTFGFSHIAEYFCEPASITQLQEAIEFALHRNLAVFMLGAGSNIVLTQNIRGLVIKLAMSSTQYKASSAECGHESNAANDEGDPKQTLVFVEGGVNWHSLVRDTAERELYGLENLTLIPGNAGAAPIQNIGAYGSELKHSLVELSAINLKTGEQISMSNSDCQFGYRDSIFKNELAGEIAIINLTLQLSLAPRTETTYQALADELQRRMISDPSAMQVSDAVAAIRQSKLPDPAVLGNAGSFFKNPTISESQLNELLTQWPELPRHSAGLSQYKIPAGWLVEEAGWKGHRAGNVGVHDRQALVLVNYGDGSGQALLELAKTVRESVEEKFGVSLEQEPLTI